MSRTGWKLSPPGLAADQEQFGVSLLGGDTGRDAKGRLRITVTAFGFVPAGQNDASGAARRPGDAVYVTGTIGDSGGGLADFPARETQL